MTLERTLIDQKSSAQGKWLVCLGGWTDGERTNVPDPTKKVVYKFEADDGLVGRKTQVALVKSL